MSEPTIPNEPTIPISAPPQDIDPPEEDKPKAGRPSNKELAADVRRLETDNRRLRDLLGVLAAMPDDPAKPADAVLYQLRRGNETCEIRCGHIRRAREALKS